MPPPPACHAFHDPAYVKAAAAALKMQRVSICSFKILSVIFIPPLLLQLLWCSRISSSRGFFHIFSVQVTWSYRCKSMKYKLFKILLNNFIATAKLLAQYFKKRARFH